MPYGNPGGYRTARRNAPARRNGSGRGGRGGGSNAALVSALQQVLQRFSGGGRRGSTTQGRLGKGMRAAARGRPIRVGDNEGFGFDDDSEGNYGGGPLRIGHRM